MRPVTEMHGVWFRTVTIYKNNIWSVGLYEAYEDNGEMCIRDRAEGATYE